MTQLRYSVIIPSLNEEKFLPKLLDSLAGQSIKNFEVIVVDGGSVDATIAKAKLFTPKVPRLRIVISSPPNLPKQRNDGASHALGEWLVFVDADSILVPYFFERIEGFISQHSTSLFTTWFQPDSESSSDALLTLLANMAIEGLIAVGRPQAPGPLTVVKRSSFSQLGGYDERLKFGEDVDFGQRARAMGVNVDILRETLCIWSLRRFRRQGKMRVMRTYTKALVSLLLTKKPPKSVKDYLMGGHLYDQNNAAYPRATHVHAPVYTKRIQEFFKELFT